MLREDLSKFPTQRDFETSHSRPRLAKGCLTFDIESTTKARLIGDIAIT